MDDPFDIPLRELRARTSNKWASTSGDELALWVAEMDVRLAPAVTDALQRAVTASDTGYANNSLPYREAFAGFAERQWNWHVGPEHCEVFPDLAASGTEMLRQLAGEGGRVILTSPCYPAFRGWLEDADLPMVDVPLLGVGARAASASGPGTTVDAGGSFDLDALDRAFGQGARVLLLTNPHNPTGRAFTRDELAAVAEVAETHGAWVLADEVHAPLTMPGTTFVPFLSTCPAAERVGVALHSASKGFNLAGLKASLVVTHPRGPHLQINDDVLWSVGQFGLLAGQAAFADSDAWLATVRQQLARRVRHLQHRLATELPVVRFQPPQAGFLAWLDFTEALPGVDDPAAWLHDAAGLTLSSGLQFGQGTGWLRLNFATSMAVLHEALDRMVAAVGPTGA